MSVTSTSYEGTAVVAEQETGGRSGTSSYWSETAYEWWQRCAAQRSLNKEVPCDPCSAAWDFCRPAGWGSGGTGIAFLDDALRRKPMQSSSSSHLHHSNNDDPTTLLPVVEVRGEVGKTWTVVTLASRFAVATRPSRFENDEASSKSEHCDNPPSVLPQVLVLNSTYDVTTAKLAYAVRSTLLRQSGTSTSATDFERAMQACLGRIHVMNADDIMGWVPLLEMIRIQLLSATTGEPSSDHPTLIVWDGFLSEPHDEASRMEVIYQLGRLIQECSVMLVTACSGKKQYAEWDKYVTHRIWLERNSPGTQSPGQGHRLQATSHGFRTPFSLSLGGILS